MGVVNATPDSFSDGGAYDPLRRALELAEQGADIIDIGGESTRPGAPAVAAAEERARTEPVIRELAKRVRIDILDYLFRPTRRRGRACGPAFD